jgi:hypothetical protein
LGSLGRKRAIPQRAITRDGYAKARRQAPPVEIVDRPRRRNQWPTLPASRRVCAVGGLRAWAEDAGRRASSPPDSTPI